MSVLGPLGTRAAIGTVMSGIGARVATARTAAADRVGHWKMRPSCRAEGSAQGSTGGLGRWESVIIAPHGTVLGMLVGVFFGWAPMRDLCRWGRDVCPLRDLLLSRQRGH